MDTRIFRNMIEVIKAEQLRRQAELDSVDPNLQYDQWQFTDLPFVNELYLMVLLTLRHYVERELVKIAAREGHQGKEISDKDYAANVRQEREALIGKNGKDGWKKLNIRLKLKQCKGYQHMEVLRFLANSYKHDPWLEPDKKLLKQLNLNLSLPYAPLPESAALQEGLAQFVGLRKDAPYCDTVEQFVNKAAAFLEDVQKQTVLSKVKWKRISFSIGVMAH